MRRYFANLDSVPTHAALSQVLDREQLDKWAVLDSIRVQLRVLPDGFEKPQQYVMPETRWEFVDHSINIKPGDFGVLIPGEHTEFAFQRVGNFAANNSALFEYQSRHWVFDREGVNFEVVCERPETYVMNFPWLWH